MIRKPVVAGRFYPDNPTQLKSELGQYLKRLKNKTDRSYDRLVMLPHAGYMFSGEACGKTIMQANLAPTVVLLGPNHTGLGSSISVWSSGAWEFPGGMLEVDDVFAQKLIDSKTGYVDNQAAHAREHSLEVLLPFLHYLNPETKIVPVCISESSPVTLHKAGELLADIISEYPEPVSIVVSSDMSHFISAAKAKKMDSMALEAVIRLDPADFYSIVSSNQISMCGVLPMTVGMYAAKKNGASSGRLIEYTNSGKVTGDYESVVAYAGVIIS
ncbi:AmmeMemoRadiSam system protein B [Maridesulfovibrio zosterae]|uniref:AmmeMemoRadiSam system protein B n=1 Tax=Maridesulfovibrio zosterae TaxID=82171 RepID=UPI00040C4D7E|nr:AmmeMemoRadiSam system protein B [Maridesulfovibrio zosterae]